MITRRKLRPVLLLGALLLPAIVVSPLDAQESTLGTLVSNGGLIEYSCEENNKSLWEGRIKIWTPPGASPPRTR